MSEPYNDLANKLQALWTELPQAGMWRGMKIATEIFDLVIERMPMIYCALANHDRLSRATKQEIVYQLPREGSQ